MRALPILCLLALGLPALAQDRAGRDTPGEWIVDHAKSVGLWDSFCDHRVTGEMREERCYLRYVDVFAREPRFAAQFVFVTPGPEVEFGIERRQRFDDDGLRIEAAGAAIWSSDRRDCLRGGGCTYTDGDATTLIEAMITGDTFAFDFTDASGTDHALRWDLTGFEAAWEDFSAQSRQRGL